MKQKEKENKQKHVEFKALDDERRVAIGGVLVPNKVDLQGDFVRPETIAEFADDFMASLQAEVEDAEGGVMHAVFPEEHVTLAENRVLDETREIAGKEFEAGSWVQGWKFEDDELWALVEDGVLSGYSVGIDPAEWSAPMSQDELPDGVEVAEAYPEDEPVWELRGEQVREVSAVDIPAVPDAEIVEAKSAGMKSILDAVDGKNEFVAVIQDRGATEDEAERLWHYLQRALEESDTDGKSTSVSRADDSVLTRIGKAALGALTREEQKSPVGGGSEKESRTLSEANVRRLMASHDAIEDALSTELDFNTNRFTDDPGVDFDVANFEGKVSTDENASGGENPGSSKQMSDDDSDSELEDKVDALEEKFDGLMEKLGDSGGGTEEGEKDGEGGGTGDGDGGSKDGDGNELEDKIEELEEKFDERLEALAEASGKSQQIDGGETDNSQNSDRKFSPEWDKTFGLAGTGGN